MLKYLIGLWNAFISVIRRIFGWRIGSTDGSNLRRALTRVCAVLALYIFVEITIRPDRSFTGNIFSAVGAIIVAIYNFVDVVFLVLFRESEKFRVNPSRLVRDALVSAALMIMSFAQVYRLTGLNPEGSSLDHVYFSAVTFSTLGFGDFAPEGLGKAFAAIEALIGNLHLGIIVAATFLSISRISTDEAAD